MHAEKWKKWAPHNGFAGLLNVLIDRCSNGASEWVTANFRHGDILFEFRCPRRDEKLNVNIFYKFSHEGGGGSSGLEHFFEYSFALSDRVIMDRTTSEP